MRTFKFRAYIKNKHEVLDVESIFFGIEVVECITKEGFDIQYDLAEVELLQYTGLKDKNGKEIYEDDIIKYKTNYYGKLKENNITVVKWTDDLEHDGFGEPLAMGYIFRGYDFEIIGNIFENPELLES